MTHPEICVEEFYSRSPPLCLGKFSHRIELPSPPQTQNPPKPMVWHTHFPPDVVADFVSWSNPAGGTTNSNL